MAKYRKLQNQVAPPDWAISSFAFEPLATLPRKAGSIRNSISSGSDDNSVKFGIKNPITKVLLVFQLVLPAY